jgi:hypothetical protein
MGWRLLATSLLPVSHSTLCYGSNDSGHSVLNSNADVSERMRSVAKKLNLKGHYCGLKKQEHLYGPCDIEGHIGTDKRFYVLGTSKSLR